MKKRKFECNDCEADCELTIQMGEFTPSYCPYDKEKANWHEVVDSAENSQTEQLPDWVKFDRFAYDNVSKRYLEIIYIGKTSIDIKYTDNNYGDTYSRTYMIKYCTEARKRPFNEAEMKELVGKILTHKQTGDLTLVTDFINEYDKDLDYHYSTVFAFGENYTDGDLMDDCTIDGKPCYVLEHLENGEWVE
jgi:hypothetical protein